MKHFNTVIVGGGIVGAGIFRDLSLHNVNVLIIDKGDFSSMTSSKSSKMLHGGIRYLENFDFPLVYEALHEKNLWTKIAPHLCYSTPFYLPVFKNSKRPLFLIKIGLFLYDLLSLFKNRPHKIATKMQTLQEFPQLNPKTLKGSGVYYDAIVDDSKLNLEIIYDALNNNPTKTEAKNYSELISFTKKNNKYYLEITNLISKENFYIDCNHLIFATGPFTDNLLKKFNHFKWNDVLLPSKGSHLYIPRNKINLPYPIVITTRDDRVVFVIPHDEKILVGTTEIPTSEDFFTTGPTTAELNYLISELNNYFPSANINQNDILYSFSGIRPLVKEDDSNLKKTSREHKVYQPESNIYIITGGKYTTFRVMGNEITREICHKNSISYNCDLSTMPLQKKSVINSFNWKLPNKSEVEDICKNEMPKTFEDFFKRRLSIPNRKIWELKTKTSFLEFYNSHKEILNKYLVISENDIQNF